MKSFFVSVATLFGCGRFPIAPGTVGSALGMLLYIAWIRNLAPLAAAILMAFFVFSAVVICDVAEKEIGEKDPGCIILDEFTAIPICFLGVQRFIHQGALPWAIPLLGFVLFRFFDVVKPLGIRKVQNLPGGIGIVADDVVAAVYTNIAIILICLTAL
ncbi:MAG: phosphatidylglycerophosphatase A [Puniceicoccales bacterium]|jgi:phosphatidylglycerophosphatase A|nr:phosphatidylglycerophosphatase A [Puniceicoccales bacterium]